MNKWFAQIFKRDERDPYFEGEFLDFQVLKEKIATEVRFSSVLVRIIGPDQATPEQLQELRDLGAHPTWPDT